MANVSVIDCTGYPDFFRPIEVLMFAKSTRLTLDPQLMDDIRAAPAAEKIKALEEIAKTIPSCWEFIDITFLVEGVSRACAQQMTRTRTASYAMQSQRAVNVSDSGVVNPFGDDQKELAEEFNGVIDSVFSRYDSLIKSGAEPQQARGVLPLNIECNLLAKYNLRSFVDLVHSRSSLRTQGEYADIVKKMVSAISLLWPWVNVFLQEPLSAAIKELEAVAVEVGVTPGNGIGWRIAKAIDLLRRSL